MKTLLILFTSITFCFAQEASKGRVIQYFDKQWKTTTDPSAASFFRTVEDASGKYIIRDYYSSGVLQMEGECTAYDPKIEYEGKVTRYDENGKIEEECFYEDDKRNGPSRTFYKNGKLKGDRIYRNDEPFYNHFYSPDGLDLLVNGSGILPDTTSNQRLMYLEIIAGKEFGSFTIEGGDTVYHMVEKQCEYIGGYDMLANDLRENLKYPASARDKGYQGTVFVGFMVTKDGESKDFLVVKGFHPDCDAEALRVMKELPYWNPAEHHNKKVNSKFIMPIKYKLAKPSGRG